MSGANPQRRGGHGSREIRLVEERYNEAEGKTQRIETGGLKNKGIKFFFYSRLTARLPEWKRSVAESGPRWWGKHPFVMLNAPSLWKISRLALFVLTLSSGIMAETDTDSCSGLIPVHFKEFYTECNVFVPLSWKNNVFVHLQRATYSKSSKKKKN